MAIERDDEIRAAAFSYLRAIVDRSGGQATRAELEGFRFEGQPLRLIAPRQGIWKPRQLTAALSLTTTYTPPNESPPYEDDVGPDGYWRYKWRGTNPMLADNIALRRAMKTGKPLIWLNGAAPGIYLPEFPVWLVDEEPSQYQFVVAFDEVMRDGWVRGLADADPLNPVRRYAEATVRVRLHQRPFRDRVLRAYNSQCALCHLRHPVLLDAAHIKEDSEGGQPIVPNGVAMCAIHHRAFDAFVLGVRPDYKIVIRRDVLAEHDGPTLQHSLQGLHGARLVVPRRRVEQPDPELLEERFERFLAAS